mmetsp:Transcript_38713/g.103807  ORF Transcript_38713/g.103807 Transcript_38713/m.103807 type:complete len:243 (-) Transcript_38713:972-1700(-)
MGPAADTGGPFLLALCGLCCSPFSSAGAGRLPQIFGCGFAWAFAFPFAALLLGGPLAAAPPASSASSPGSTHTAGASRMRCPRSQLRSMSNTASFTLNLVSFQLCSKLFSSAPANPCGSASVAALRSMPANLPKDSRRTSYSDLCSAGKCWHWTREWPWARQCPHTFLRACCLSEPEPAPRPRPPPPPRPAPLARACPAAPASSSASFPGASLDSLRISAGLGHTEASCPGKPQFVHTSSAS